VKVEEVEVEVEVDFFFKTNTLRNLLLKRYLMQGGGGWPTLCLTTNRKERISRLREAGGVDVS
jgi:hypothetical protein